MRLDADRSESTGQTLRGLMSSIAQILLVTHKGRRRIIRWFSMRHENERIPGVVGPTAAQPPPVVATCVNASSSTTAAGSARPSGT